MIDTEGQEWGCGVCEMEGRKTEATKLAEVQIDPLYAPGSVPDGHVAVCRAGLCDDCATRPDLEERMEQVIINASQRVLKEDDEVLPA